MALILPKGIVVNSDQVQGSIERIDAEPLDEADIAKVWKVYTTTQRRLLDPTAERLENLWWRIWGSRRKELKGAIVARLFAQISDGETFVPLRGPPNRHEGSPPLTSSSRHGSGASSANNLQQPNRSRPSTNSSSTASRAPNPMPHPILKKTRGPSTTGPRPTARFISPHESQDETDDFDQTAASSPNTHVVVQPPSPSTEASKPKAERKPALQNKKTFVASTRKKRPLMVRRQSSQTSQSSPDVASKASDSASSAIQSSSERTPPTFAAQNRSNVQSKFQENFTPTLETPAPNRGKARATRRLDADTSSQRRTVVESQSEDVLAGDPGPSKQVRRIENLQQHADELSAEELEELELQRMLLEEANAVVRQRQQTTQAIQTPSLPESAHEGLRILQGSLASQSLTSPTTEASNARYLLRHEDKGSSRIAPTGSDIYVDGQINLGSVGNQTRTPTAARASTKLDKGKGRETDDTPQNPMFAKRPVQPISVAASPEISGPLSRSKSQLTLLLEKDRERSSGKKSGRDVSEGKKK